jgi:hypothetical protein
LLSELIIPSLLILLLTYFVLDPFDHLASKIILDLVGSPLGGADIFADIGGFMVRLGIALLVIVGFSMIGGLGWGQAGSWVGDRFPSHHPLVRMTAGLRPPIVTVSVLSNMQIGAGQLVYEGTLDTIQIGPEGRVDLIVLKAPRKSLVRPPQQQRGPAEVGETIPKAIRPFVPIGGQDATKDDLLFIESDDIGNVFFHTVPGAGGNWLDRIVAGFVRPKPKISDADGLKPEPSPPEGLRLRADAGQPPQT